MKTTIVLTTVGVAAAFQQATDLQPAAAHTVAHKVQESSDAASKAKLEQTQFEKDLHAWEATDKLHDPKKKMSEIVFDFDADDDDYVSERRLLMNKGQLSGNRIEDAAKPFKDGFTTPPTLIPQGPQANQAAKDRWLKKMFFLPK